MTEPVTTAAIVAICMGLLELVKYLVGLVTNKDKSYGLTFDEKESLKNVETQIRDLHIMHDVRDSDGTPLWYVPRSWVTTQKDILETVEKVAHSQEVLGISMERMVGILDRIDRRQNKQ